MSSEFWTAGMKGDLPMYSGFMPRKMWCMAVLNTMVRSSITEPGLGTSFAMSDTTRSMISFRPVMIAFCMVSRPPGLLIA